MKAGCSIVDKPEGGGGKDWAGLCLPCSLGLPPGKKQLRFGIDPSSSQGALGGEELGE